MRHGAFVLPSVLVLAVLVLGAPPRATAQKVPVGSEFQVNTYTTSEQGDRTVAAAADPAGNFVIVWNGAQDDGDYSGVFGQRYNSAGHRLGSEFQVNSYTSRFQGYDGASVAMDAGGNFVVAWTSDDYRHYPSSDDNYGIFAQRFASAGGGQGGEFQVNTLAPYAYYRRRPDVAADGAGTFVVVWSTYGQDGSGWGVFGQRHDSAGATIGGQFQVNTYTTDDQGYRVSSVAADAAGNFVVVWPGNGSGYSRDVLGQRFDSTGAKVGNEFQVNTTTYLGPSTDVASDAAGNFVVVWNGVDGDYTGVLGQRFDSTGATIGGEFQVNTYTTGEQGYRGLALTSDPDGNFVVAWAGEAAGTGGDYAVVVQQFDSTGAKVGGELQVADGGVDRHSLALAAAASGDFVVAWKSYPGSDVFAQRFGDGGGFTCTPAPLPGCREQIVTKRGALRFRESPNPNLSSLNWVWSKGEATSAGDFGDPRVDTSYTFCVYDSSLSSQPLIATAIPAAATCGPSAIPCWRELTGAGPPLMYLDGERSRGGVAQNRLKPNLTDGNAKVTLRARGPALALPPTPLTPPVIAQLQGSHGECFTSRYDAFVKKNADGQFRALPGTTTTTTTSTTTTTVPTTTTTTTIPVCGDAVLNPAEECDDANTANGDGCSSACLCNPATTPGICNLTGNWEIPDLGTTTVTITEDGAGNSTLSGTAEGVPFTGSMTRSDSCATGTLTVLGFTYATRATVADDCTSFTGVVQALSTVLEFVRVP
jgi:cysteine-rich repeat protein